MSIEPSAKAAALASLLEFGFNIDEETDDRIEGRRPHKIGLFVGSGGERATVTIKAISDTQTQVSVDTRKTVIGVAGQKNWEDEIVASIQNAFE